MNIRTRNNAYDDNQDFLSALTLLIHVTPLSVSIPYLFYNVNDLLDE